MHYFQFNIKSYQAATVHLTNDEDIAYRRLIEMYYDTEQPIPTAIPQLSRRLRVGINSIEIVLSEFFELTEDGWIHPYCDSVITEYHAYTNKQRINGSKGGRGNKAGAKPDKPTALPDKPSAQPITNQEPITNNQDKDKDKEQAAKPAHRKTSGTPTRGTQYPADFYPDAKGVDLADSFGISLAIELEKFSDYHRSKGNVMKDWQAAWRLWARNSVKFATGNQPRSSPSRDSERKGLTEYLTGKGRQIEHERDITGEAVRVA